MISSLLHKLVCDLEFTIYLQWRVQEFVRGGGAKISFFLLFNIFQGGGAAQKIADKMLFPTIKVAKFQNLL